MGFTVFYVWQSDRDEKSTRFLIRDAAERAIKRIANDADIDDAPALDFGTKGEPGTPDVVETILRKINECGVLLADVTFVAEIGEEGSATARKRIPNPNVMIELGYAINAIGWRRIILVMNTAFGEPGDLPFDLARRSWPIQYEWTSASEQKRSEVVEQLSRLLESNVRDTINAGVLPRQESAAAKMESASAAAERQRLEFHQRVKNGTFADINPENGALAVCVIPASTPKIPIDLIKAEQRLTRQLQPISAGGWDSRIGAKYLRTFRKLGDSKANRAATEIDDCGIIVAARGELLFQRMMPGGSVDTERRWIEAGRLPADVITGIGRSLGALRQLGITPPWFVGIALLGLSSCRLSVDARYGNDEAETFEGDDIVPPLITIESDSDALATTEGIVALVRSALDYVAREFNYVRFPGL